METVNKVKLFGNSLNDLRIISALCQDSVGNMEHMHRSKKGKSFSILLNRFRWELLNQEKSERIKTFRIPSVLFFRWVLSVKSKRLKTASFNEKFSLLGIDYKNFNGSKGLILIFSGGAEILIEVEYLEVFLKDIGSTYSAVSGKIPRHNNLIIGD